MKKFLKEKFNIIWLGGIVLIIVGLVLGLRVNKLAGQILTVVGMIIPILLLIFERSIKGNK